MTMHVQTLLEALPREVDEAPSQSARQQLDDLVAELSKKAVPVSRAVRLWILGSVQAKIAAGYLAWWLRSGFVARDQRERLLNETHLASAIKLLGAMGYLRGAVTKAGQLLGAYPNLVSEDFFKTLSTLHFEAPPMHYSLIREHLRDELGGDPQELFAEFETQAFAAASLGQVHRARLKSGERVAVKVQYPGIAQTINADFRNFLAITAPMRLSRDWENVREQWEDVRRTMTQETDYRREALLMEQGRGLFSPDEGIVIPRHYPQLSTSKVLTMDYLEGVHIDDYLATRPSQQERDRHGALIMRASFRIAHKGKFWYADSNPGNYLFLHDGRLGVLDFGCCREYTACEWDFYVQMWMVYQRGCKGLREATLRSIAIEPGQAVNEEYVRFIEEFSHWWSDYLLHDEVHDFGDEAFMQRGLEFFAQVARKRYFRSLPMNIWIIRQLMGLRILAHRLKARINMHRMAKEEAWGLPLE